MTFTGREGTYRDGERRRRGEEERRGGVRRREERRGEERRRIVREEERRRGEEERRRGGEEERKRGREFVVKLIKVQSVHMAGFGRMKLVVRVQGQKRQMFVSDLRHNSNLSSDEEVISGDRDESAPPRDEKCRDTSPLGLFCPSKMMTSPPTNSCAGDRQTRGRMDGGNRGMEVEGKEKEEKGALICVLLNSAAPVSDGREGRKRDADE
ncbi:unnamed protein product [Pleuronectes platessa]|uniref:Uncharacterized protein n=1 Tax=Pleuronectes platessa TaxID=8262 RepID=A0A9N7TW48_PLEPL|nr:unnamed protein product [Pleuronectes platessa]